MNHNPYLEYYKQQGKGLPGFSGARFQRGKGFFGSLFRGTILPMFKYLGKKGLELGKDVAADYLENPETFKESAKKRLKTSGFNIAEDAINAAKTKMIGEGARRRKRRKPTRVPRKVMPKRAPRRKKRTTKKRRRTAKSNFRI